MPAVSSILQGASRWHVLRTWSLLLLVGTLFSGSAAVAYAQTGTSSISTGTGSGTSVARPSAGPSTGGAGSGGSGTFVAGPSEGPSAPKTTSSSKAHGAKPRKAKGIVVSFDSNAQSFVVQAGRKGADITLKLSPTAKFLRGTEDDLKVVGTKVKITYKSEGTDNVVVSACVCNCKSLPCTRCCP